MEILRSMLTTISRPREETSPFAPRLLRTNIDPEKIGALDRTGRQEDPLDPGDDRHGDRSRRRRHGDDRQQQAECVKPALAQVEACTATVQVGKIYDGRVTSIKDFGAFVEILPGRDGLCHISELSDDYVNSVSRTSAASATR